MQKRPKWIKNEDYERFVYMNIDYTGFYKRIYFRNCEIVKKSDYIVFYIRNTINSGAYKTYQYAQNQRKIVIEV